MEPMSDFEQLVPRDRFTTFSCGHIVPSSHVMGAVVPLGPKGQTLEFTHASWQQPAMLDELAVALGNYTNIVPHGMVVFFPSYATLDAALARWQHTHALERLSRRKKVLTEPKDAKTSMLSCSSMRPPSQILRHLHRKAPCCSPS